AQCGHRIKASRCWSADEKDSNIGRAPGSRCRARAEGLKMSSTIDTPPPLHAPASPSVPDHNRTGVDFRRPIPRPKVDGIVIDLHCHLLARRHAEKWFEAAQHYGIDCFLSMSQLEEAIALLRDYTGRIQFIAVPKFRDEAQDWVSDWLRRLEAFYNLGSRM